jgi:hypothetical protein
MKRLEIVSSDETSLQYFHWMFNNLSEKTSTINEMTFTKLHSCGTAVSSEIDMYQSLTLSVVN